MKAESRSGTHKAEAPSAGRFEPTTSLRSQDLTSRRFSVARTEADESQSSSTAPEPRTKHTPSSAVKPVEAANLGDAIRLAHVLVKTLNMPQQPDAIAITGPGGKSFYSGALIGAGDQSRKLITMNANNNTNPHDRRLSRWASGRMRAARPADAPWPHVWPPDEPDRSWTAITCSPACRRISGPGDGRPQPIGCNRWHTSLNLHDTGRRNERIDLSAGAAKVSEFMGCQG